MNHFLSNAWSVSGTDKSSFFAGCDAVDRKTSYRTISMKELVLHHLYRDEKGVLKSTKIDPALALPEALTDDGDEIITFIEEHFDKSFLEETLKDGLIFTLRGEKGEMPIFVAPQAYNTFGQRIDLPGAAMQHSSLGRECHIADHVAHHAEKQTCTAVIKQNDGVDKAFALLSASYRPIALNILEGITKSLEKVSGIGESNGIRWTINHAMAEIVLEFPEYGDKIKKAYGLKDELTPCIKLMSSDTGECAVRAVGFWRTNSGDEIITDEYARKHKGAITPNEIVENIQKEVFDKYEVLPKTLQSLQFIPVTPKDLDLSLPKRPPVKPAHIDDPAYDGDEAVQKAKADYEAACIAFKKDKKRYERNLQYNGDILLKVHMAIIKDLKLPSILGQKNSKSMEEAISSMISSSQHYSAYAVAKNIMCLPNYLHSWIVCENGKDLAQSVIEKLQKAVSKAAYEPFDMLTEKAKKKSSKLYLVVSDDEAEKEA